MHTPPSVFPKCRLEAECEELKSSLAVKTTELKDLDTAYQGVAEQLATAWEEISALESEKGELQQSLMDASAKHVSEVNILVATATENAAKAADAITQAQRDLLNVMKNFGKFIFFF